MLLLWWELFRLPRLPALALRLCGLLAEQAENALQVELRRMVRAFMLMPFAKAGLLRCSTRQHYART